MECARVLILAGADIHRMHTKVYGYAESPLQRVRYGDKVFEQAMIAADKELDRTKPHKKVTLGTHGADATSEWFRQDGQALVLTEVGLDSINNLTKWNIYFAPFQKNMRYDVWEVNNKPFHENTTVENLVDTLKKAEAFTSLLV